MVYIYAIFLCVAANQQCTAAELGRWDRGYYIPGATYTTAAECEALAARYTGSNDPRQFSYRCFKRVQEWSPIR